ncbi:biopolymer transport protein ExbD [Xanthomonas arboricola]|nr:biopolymer transport protein ExbD [Xanthomonas euroxanthea]
MTEQMHETAGNQPELRIAVSADAEYAVMAKLLAEAKKMRRPIALVLCSN